jgi:hypothetical protein
LPPTGARTLNSKTAFYYGYTLDSPGMIMRVPQVGSQYLMGFVDANKKPYDGGKTYKVTLPKGIPAAAFWSFTLYDNQSRSMLQTPQGYPRAGSQSYPSPAAEADADGSTTIYFGPTQPTDVKSATGFKPCVARAGSRSFASTVRLSLSSRKSGVRARSSWSNKGKAGDARWLQKGAAGRLLSTAARTCEIGGYSLQVQSGLLAR